MRIIISSRKSDLARIQAHQVGAALQSAHPHLEIKFNFRESLGDKNLNDPLWRMPDKGVFTQDFLQDLIDGETDLVVHSWKDLPVEQNSQTIIAATLPRGDQRDVLLFRQDRWRHTRETAKVTILSSSPRRAYNLESFLKEAMPTILDTVEFVSVRGNVPTRVQKLFAQNVDGLVVAKAALDRLLSEHQFGEMREGLLGHLRKCFVMIIPLEKNPTAAGQGALAIEINSKRKDLKELLGKIHCQKTYDGVVEERKRLKEYGGGCHQKVGVSYRTMEYGSILYTRALTDLGNKIDQLEFFPGSTVRKIPADKIFPQNSSQDAQWFERQKLDVKVPGGPLWVAKAEALPEKAAVSMTQRVWASGWETWKRLAKRGIWVSGCSESLGEGSGLESFPLWKDEPSWTKLTHDRAPSRSIKSLATYKLIPLEKGPLIEGKSHFYWMSGSSFLRALELHPWLKDAHHYCGPGNTFDIISEKANATIFPTYRLWKEQVLE